MGYPWFMFAKTSMPGSKTDPFSKITVESKTAVLRKDSLDKSRFHLKYDGDVTVVFADNTKLTADSLDVFLSSKPSGLEKAIFTKNVFLKRSDQEVRADRAEILFAEKICKLIGNVRIKQIEDKKKIDAVCCRAKFLWEEDEITLLGDSKNRVSTTIKLDEKFSLAMKNKKNKKEKT
jgi:lipopolysaccharide export system protein LptA